MCGVSQEQNKTYGHVSFLLVAWLSNNKELVNGPLD